MKNLAGKFAKRGDLMMDFCAGTCLSAKAYMALDQHRKFVGGELDSEVLSAT